MLYGWKWKLFEGYVSFLSEKCDFCREESCLRRENGWVWFWVGGFVEDKKLSLSIEVGIMASCSILINGAKMFWPELDSAQNTMTTSL